MNVYVKFYIQTYIQLQVYIEICKSVAICWQSPNNIEMLISVLIKLLFYLFAFKFCRMVRRVIKLKEEIYRYDIAELKKGISLTIEVNLF